MSAPPLLLHVFPSFAIGGAQARFVTLANRFGPRFRHAIVAIDGDRRCGERLDAALDVVYPDIALRKGDTFGTVRRCRALVRSLRPDVLVTSNWGSIEWAMANAWPIVPHLHMEDGFGPDERDGQLPRRVFTRRVLLRRSLVMLPSRTLQKIATEIWRLPVSRLRYIPNGIDLAAFHVDRERTIPRETAPVIGTVAGLRPEKNVARLIRAFALVRAAMPARLVIVGDGPERGRLEALASELGIASDTLFLGHVTAPASSYAGFDVFALSSDTEQMPISVLEAMASSLPVAATNVGDIAGMVAPENALYIVKRDEHALASAMLSLLSDPAARRSAGAANRLRAEQEYDVDRMVRAHAELIDEARRSRPAAGRQLKTAATPHPNR